MLHQNCKFYKSCMKQYCNQMSLCMFQVKVLCTSGVLDHHVAPASKMSCFQAVDSRERPTSSLQRGADSILWHYQVSCLCCVIQFACCRDAHSAYSLLQVLAVSWFNQMFILALCEKDCLLQRWKCGTISVTGSVVIWSVKYKSMFSSNSI